MKHLTIFSAIFGVVFYGTVAYDGSAAAEVPSENSTTITIDNSIFQRYEDCSEEVRSLVDRSAGLFLLPNIIYKESIPLEGESHGSLTKFVKQTDGTSGKINILHYTSMGDDPQKLFDSKSLYSIDGKVTFIDHLYDAAFVVNCDATPIYSTIVPDTSGMQFRLQPDIMADDTLCYVLDAFAVDGKKWVKRYYITKDNKILKSTRFFWTLKLADEEDEYTPELLSAEVSVDYDPKEFEEGIFAIPKTETVITINDLNEISKEMDKVYARGKKQSN